MSLRILIDTDPGVDDALALFFALGTPRAQVAQVTTCCGNADISTVSRNARFILNVVGASLLPVSQGAHEPRAQSPLRSVVHGKAALGGIDAACDFSAGVGGDTSFIDAATVFLSAPCEEPRTLVAMTLRSVVWLAIAGIGRQRLLHKRPAAA